MIITLIILLLMFGCFIYYLTRLGARGEHFSKAATETIIVYFISNLPIMFLAWASLSSNSTNSSDALVLNIGSLIKGGEVFIYVSAILAPVVWALIAYFKDTHRILAGLYLLALIIILPFSAFSFQQVRLTENLNQGAIDISALLLYCVSLILWFGAVVYTRFIESYERSDSGNSVLDGLRGAK